MAIQDLIALMMELMINLLRGLRTILEALVPHITVERLTNIIPSMVEAIYPAILWVLNLLGGVFDITRTSGYDVVNQTSGSPGDPGTPASAFGGMVGSVGNSTSTIIGPPNGTSGLTYIINGTTEVMTNTSSGVGSEVLVEVYNFIAWVIGVGADFLASVPEAFI